MSVTDDPISESADRGRETVACVRAGLDSGKSASIAQIVELIREVTCKFETISVQELGEVIGRDLLTMSRVISVAHTLGYNPDGVEIGTIIQAIHVIGLNKIRHLTLSLMLVQNPSSDAVIEKRNVAVFALVSGRTRIQESIKLVRLLFARFISGANAIKLWYFAAARAAQVISPGVVPETFLR